MISISPHKEKFRYSINTEEEARKIDDFAVAHGRKTVVVQGLGFVGAAMVATLSNARDKKGNLSYNVIGIDLSDEDNYWKIAMVNMGKPPIVSSDPKLERFYRTCHKNGNLMATYSEHAYTKADIVVVDINLDIEKKELGIPYDYAFSYEGYKKAICAIAQKIGEGTLVVIESTVPPGSMEKVIYPIFKEVFAKRGLDVNKLFLGHSYERVMPGKKYIDSIINFYRVYSGINVRSKKKTKEFLESFTNTEDFPLRELESPAASEMSKVLENSYRAMNISFIKEWTDFAEQARVNLFEIVDAIRVRPTHKNIMSPGFGVGGYCLTKDALLADWSYRNLFGNKGHLKLSLDAVGINDLMPDHTFKLLKKEIPDLKGVNITVLGVSYRHDIADTRCSPTELFYDRCVEDGAIINLHDEYVTYWNEKKITICTDLNALKNKKHDVVVFAVRHEQYLKLGSKDIAVLFKGVKIIIDANNVINDKIARGLIRKGIKIIGVGKGHWRNQGVFK
jgi:UDP-N-acetyl-D-glucosamine dehydrogenase